MCHFGMDTLSWARLGAVATGVDFSPDAIAYARTLAKEVDVPADFQCANVYDLPDVLEGTFDIVVMTYGVLYWLPDLPAFARIVARFLKPGGIFCVIDWHPMNGVASRVDDRLEVTGSYFGRGGTEREVTTTYADGRSLPAHPESTWGFTVGDLVTALASAGLCVQRLRELPYDLRARTAGMVQADDGSWHLPGDPLPLLLCCTATRH